MYLLDILILGHTDILLRPLIDLAVCMYVFRNVILIFYFASLGEFSFTQTYFISLTKPSSSHLDVRPDHIRAQARKSLRSRDWRLQKLRRPGHMHLQNSHAQLRPDTLFFKMCLVLFKSRYIYNIYSAQRIKVLCVERLYQWMGALTIFAL